MELFHSEGKKKRKVDSLDERLGSLLDGLIPKVEEDESVVEKHMIKWLNSSKKTVLSLLQEGKNGETVFAHTL